MSILGGYSTLCLFSWDTVRTAHTRFPHPWEGNWMVPNCRQSYSSLHLWILIRFVRSLLTPRSCAVSVANSRGENVHAPLLRCHSYKSLGQRSWVSSYYGKSLWRIFRNEYLSDRGILWQNVLIILTLFDRNYLTSKVKQGSVWCLPAFFELKGL